MTAKHLAAALSLLGMAASSPHPRADAHISWKPCTDPSVNTTLPSDCANFTVPLDYSAKSGGETIELQLARIRALIQPAKGTILLNFGGPGQAGRASLIPQAPQLLALSGGQYNLVAFDSRGTVNTIPQACYQTPSALQDFIMAQQIWYDQNDTALEDMWKRAELDVEKCHEASKKIQPYMGTASVARDLMSVTEALGEDGMLRYWGFSYGTTLGATVASMFPDKIEKMVLDGVQNPHEYYHAHADYQEFTDSDRVFSEIFRSCENVGPTKCDMAKANMTADKMEALAWNVTEQLKTSPITLKSGKMLTYSDMRFIFAVALYNPVSWPGITTFLNYVAEGDTSNPTFIKLYDSLYKSLTSDAATFVPLYGIHGADKFVRLDSLDDFRPVQDKLSNISKVMDGTSTSSSMACGLWKTNGVGRYEGDFRVKTKSPVLISSNKYDGHTPLISAKNLSSGFEGSGLLVVNGFGHTTLASASICNIKRTSAYWLNGSLPDEGFECEIDAAPFSNYTWVQAIQAVYGDILGGGSAGANGTAGGGNNSTGDGDDSSGDGDNDGGNGNRTQPPPGHSGAGKLAGGALTAVFASALALALSASLM